MTRIATIIMDDTNTLTAADWDFDPSIGVTVSEIDAPEDFDPSTYSFDPYI